MQSQSKSYKPRSRVARLEWIWLWLLSFIYYKINKTFPFMESIAGTWEIVCCNNGKMLQVAKSALRQQLLAEIPPSHKKQPKNNVKKSCRATVFVRTLCPRCFFLLNHEDFVYKTCRLPHSHPLWELDYFFMYWIHSCYWSLGRLCHPEVFNDDDSIVISHHNQYF